MLVSGVVLAVGHLLSWNIEFATKNELSLWRACSVSVLTTVLTLGCTILLSLRQRPHDEHENTPGWRTTVYNIVGFVATLVYVLARLTLVYLTVASFRSLPPGIYDDIDWLHYVPFFH